MVVSAHLHSPALSTQNAPLPSCLKNTIFFSLRPDPTNKKKYKPIVYWIRFFQMTTKLSYSTPPQKKNKSFLFNISFEKMAIFSTHNFSIGFFCLKKCFPPGEPGSVCSLTSGGSIHRGIRHWIRCGVRLPRARARPAVCVSEAGHICIHMWFISVYINVYGCFQK